MKLDDLLKKPTLASRDKEIVLNIEQKIEQNIIDPEVPIDETEQKFQEFLTLVDKAINATSGLKKVIEQTQPKEVIPATAKEKAIMKNLMDLESDVITFEIYQQALALREKLFFSKMREGMTNEQFR